MAPPLKLFLPVTLSLPGDLRGIPFARSNVACRSPGTNSFFPIEKKGGGGGGGHDFDNDNDDEVEKSFALLGGRRMLWRVEMK